MTTQTTPSTRRRDPLDISVDQRGSRGAVVQGDAVLVGAEMRALARVHVRTVQFTLVHSLILTQNQGHLFGGTYRAPARESRDVATLVTGTDTLLHEGESFRGEGRLVVPATVLPTLQGRLATSAWSIRTRVASDEAADVVRSCPLTVLSAGDVASADPASDEARGGTDVRFVDLSTRALHAGTTVSGQVELGSRAARAVLVSLVMQEEVVGGVGQQPGRRDVPGHLIEETVVDEQRLAVTAAGRPAVPFALSVPVIPAPTVTSPQLRIRWFLRARLDAPLHRHLEARIPLTAHTS